MNATTTYRYSIATASSPTVARDATADEIAECDLGQFQGAIDLPDETEFAAGLDADGKPVRVYRTRELA